MDISKINKKCKMSPVKILLNLKILMLVFYLKLKFQKNQHLVFIFINVQSLNNRIELIFTI